MRNYYHVLSLQRTATSSEIRARFHELARKWHPDQISGDDKEVAEERFQEITAAYNVLSNPALRVVHDQSMSAGGSNQPRTVDPNSASRAYVQRGVRAFREGRFAEAADSFNRAAVDSPSDARVWVYLARACDKLPNRGSMAMSAIDKACQLEETNVEYLKLAGEFFARGGLSLRAKKFYDRALQWGGPDDEVELVVKELEKLE